MNFDTSGLNVIKTNSTEIECKQNAPITIMEMDPTQQFKIG